MLTRDSTGCESRQRRWVTADLRLAPAPVSTFCCCCCNSLRGIPTRHPLPDHHQTSLSSLQGGLTDLPIPGWGCCFFTPCVRVGGEKMRGELGCVGGSGRLSSGPPSYAGSWERGIPKVEQDELSERVIHLAAMMKISMTKKLDGLIIHWEINGFDSFVGLSG